MNNNNNNISGAYWVGVEIRYPNDKKQAVNVLKNEFGQFLIFENGGRGKGKIFTRKNINRVLLALDLHLQAEKLGLEISNKSDLAYTQYNNNVAYYTAIKSEIKRITGI